METREQFVYCTMVLNDAYAEGACVVASELHKLDSNRSIVCLVAKGLLSPATLDKMNLFFSTIWFVDLLDAGSSAELSLLRRPELRYATTKFHLWNLPYKRVVYLDADTLPLRPLDELLVTELRTERSVLAAPDSGWPDMFNSGVLALEPSPRIYEQLTNSHLRSIDGSDQGVLNQELDWHRVPFLYNVTINTAYEYMPAYMRYQKDVRVLHFIGPNKPWNMPRNASPEVQKWWKARDGLNRGDISSLTRAAVARDLSKQIIVQNSPPSSSLQRPSDSFIIKPLPLVPDVVPTYKEDEIVQPDPARWEATMHAPFPNSKPEAEKLFQQLETLEISTSSDKEENTYKLPEFGPSVVRLPFEQYQTTPERVFR